MIFHGEDRNEKLRLVVTKDCPRRCLGCCNNDWDLDSLPAVDGYVWYDTIMITGGEPLLYTASLINLVLDIYLKATTPTPIYVYTAAVERWWSILCVLRYTDGITLTLHSQADVEPFQRLCAMLTRAAIAGKSMRLNVFKGIVVDIPDYWAVKRDIEWIVNCPLPENEVIMRLPTWITK